MIELYSKALEDCSPNFSALGFALSQSPDYSAEFASARLSIRIDAEPHYPGFSVQLIDRSGFQFNFRTLEQVFDPDRARQETAELLAIHTEHDFNGRRRIDIIQDGSLYSWARLCLEQTSNFVRDYQAELSDLTQAHRQAYAETERAILQKFGIRTYQ